MPARGFHVLVDVSDHPDQPLGEEQHRTPVPDPVHRPQQLAEFLDPVLDVGVLIGRHVLHPAPGQTQRGGHVRAGVIGVRWLVVVRISSHHGPNLPGRTGRPRRRAEARQAFSTNDLER